MADDQVKRAWVERVLGVSLPGEDQGDPPLTEAPGGANARLVWQTAKEAVDEKLEQLAGAMRRFNDPDLNRIAEFGIFGLTRGEGVALNKALIEYDSAGPSARATASKKLRGAVAAYRGVLTQHPAIPQLDNNPFGVRPAMRATLGAALDRIEASLS